MSKVDFIFGVITSLLAEIIFQCRYTLIISPAKHLQAVIRKTIQKINFQSLVKISVPVLTALLLVSLVNLSTQTALAPSSYPEITELTANNEDLRTIRAELIKENQELKEHRGRGLEYHRKPKDAYLLIPGVR